MVWKFKADVEFCKQNTTSDTRNYEIIRSNFPSVPLKVPNIEPKDVSCPLSCFIPATQDEVKKIKMSSSNGTCNLDPIPTTLLKTSTDRGSDCITSYGCNAK